MEQKILYGQRVVKNGNGTKKIIGGHSGFIDNLHPDFAVEVVSTYADGSRQVKFVTQFEDGTLSNIKKSTLFPESWTDAQTINAVKLVGDTKPVATRTSDGASLYQSTVNGVKVEVIKVGDNVTAGYPCGAGCASAQSFMGQ
ncbi:EndoU domain-containing protein [Pseudomonas sp. A34-9]|uniref:EndoU domain-containing protein n=1 Tax=Pseudomonas sp. A34-9 TaxID=3034675 RepID=UPI00240DE624|nr:EndoU domain-containing protein [Pseudomonas sp. A34-9]